MTQYEKITRANAMDIIRRFAKEYRKALGKARAEIIIVGGGSIMLNYKFRDSTQDFDVILQAASGVKPHTTKVACFQGVIPRTSFPPYSGNSAFSSLRCQDRIQANKRG